MKFDPDTHINSWRCSENSFGYEKDFLSSRDSKGYSCSNESFKAFEDSMELDASCSAKDAFYSEDLDAKDFFSSVETIMGSGLVGENSALSVYSAKSSGGVLA